MGIVYPDSRAERVDFNFFAATDVRVIEPRARYGYMEEKEKDELFALCLATRFITIHGPLDSLTFNFNQ